MADIVDRKTRSRMMSAIRGKDTKPELALRRMLHAKGFRYRLHDQRLPGKPDIVLPKYQAIIFVHGCFWHRHAACKYAYNPKSREEFWQSKFASNVTRDSRHREQLLSQGWRVCIVWECSLRSLPDSCAGVVGDWLKDMCQRHIEI